ncbi:autophagy-related protein 27, partial [Phenoliferia sp. Uapishka_3]
MGRIGSSTPTAFRRSRRQQVMMGADVTHPPAARGGEGLAPSVAAVVAAQEGSNQTYAAQVRTEEVELRSSRSSRICHFKDMVKALLDREGKSKPENMIFFGDGVSEGQYATVVEYEITAIKSACREIDPRYNPKVGDWIDHKLICGFRAQTDRILEERCLAEPTVILILKDFADYKDVIHTGIVYAAWTAFQVDQPNPLNETHLLKLSFIYDQSEKSLIRRFTFLKGALEDTESVMEGFRGTPTEGSLDNISKTQKLRNPEHEDDTFIGTMYHFHWQPDPRGRPHEWEESAILGQSWENDWKEHKVLCKHRLNTNREIEENVLAHPASIPVQKDFADFKELFENLAVYACRTPLRCGQPNPLNTTHLVTLTFKHNPHSDSLAGRFTLVDGVISSTESEINLLVGTPRDGSMAFLEKAQKQKPPSEGDEIYSISLCDPLPTSTPASADTCPPGTHICITTLSSRDGYEDTVISVVPIAGEIGSGLLNPTAGLREGETVAEKGWVLGMEGGMWGEVKQRANIEMVCEAGADHTAPTLVEYDSKGGLLSLKWISASACSTTSSTPPPPPPEGGDKGPPKDDDSTKDPPPPPPQYDEGKGFFGWFFTLFFLSLFAYFVGGMYYNYSQYGATGWDMVPHRDVWRDLPYIVADLFKGRGSSRNGYSALG